MAGSSWKIYWREYGADTYLYGSRLSFHAVDDVEFENELMPPGSVVKRWYSKTNYQAMRIEPSLPMIDGEGRYRICADITTEAFLDVGDGKSDQRRRKKYLKDDPGWFLRLVFYDRYDGETGFCIIRNGEGTFRCPLATYSYELQLISAGATKIHFHSVTITEIADEEQEIIQNRKKNKTSLGGGRKTERRRTSGKDGGV